MKLAIFDVDFTLTKKETLMQFYKYAIKRDFSNIVYLPRAIFSGAMFKLRIYDEKKTKEVFLKFIKGFNRGDINRLCNDFYNDVISNILYKDGLDAIKKYKEEGYHVVLISASPEFYIKKFRNIDGVDAVFGTRFLFDKNRFSCKMNGKNCKGEEKVRILNEYIKQNSFDVDFENSFMFSDSLSDKPLLDLVGNPRLINYKKKTSYLVLKWS